MVDGFWAVLSSYVIVFFFILSKNIQKRKD